MIERQGNAVTGARPLAADELQRNFEDEIFEWKQRATIWRERALMAKAMCDTLQANVTDLRRLVKALDDERDARDDALASGREEPELELELESTDREVPVEVPADAAPLAEHNEHESNGHEPNGARTEPRLAALAWTAPGTASTPRAAAPVDAPDEVVIDLAAIEAAEVAAAPAPERAPVEALVTVGAPTLDREVGVPATPAVPPSAPASVIPQVSAELFGTPEGAAEPMPDRGERRQRRGLARMGRKLKRAP